MQEKQARDVVVKQKKESVVVEKSHDAEGSKRSKAAKESKPVEIGGPKGLEPTRYGDWEAKGRCYDF